MAGHDPIKKEVNLDTIVNESKLMCSPQESQEKDRATQITDGLLGRIKDLEAENAKLRNHLKSANKHRRKLIGNLAKLREAVGVAVEILNNWEGTMDAWERKQITTDLEAELKKEKI